MVRAVIAGLAGLWLALAEPPLPPLSRAVIGTAVDHEVAAGDTLQSLAARFGVDAATVAGRNALARDARLRIGQILRIPAVHIVPSGDLPLIVSVAQRMAFVATADGVRAFPIAVGRASWQTPLGEFTVVAKETSPTWDVPLSIQRELREQGKEVVTRVPPSPENPLGDYWIGLSLPGIGIHGTNAPNSIYRATTHGCIRVHPDRIQQLFDAVDTGTRGRIIDEPLLLALVDGRIFLEVHRDPYARTPLTSARLRAMATQDCLLDRIDWTTAVAALAQREGVAIEITKSSLPWGRRDGRRASPRGTRSWARPDRLRRPGS